MDTQRTHRPRFDLSRILVVDLEATCWQGPPPPGEESEVIEIGNAILHVGDLHVEPGPEILVRPTGSSVSRFCTELTSITQALLDERDSKFTAHGDALLADAGSKVVRLPVRSPNLNASAERWVRTVREECLDRVIVLNESPLRWVLREFVRYDNSRRPHRSLDLRPPEGPTEGSEEGQVTRRQVLGGLINDYYRKAA